MNYCDEYSLLEDRDNLYKKHNNMVDAFRGIKLRDYNMETVTDLEELNGEINGSK